MGLEIPDCGKSDQEGRSRCGRQRDQRDIDDAMQLLAAVAALTLGEMLFIVPAHLGRNSGDIVSPARKDLPYDRFDTFTHMDLKMNRRHGFALSGQKHTITPKALAAAQGIFC